MRVAGLIFGVVTCVLAACGGSVAPGGGSGGAGGNNTVSGSVGGVSFTPATAIGLIQSASGSTTCTLSLDGGTACNSVGAGQVAGVALVNRADATCSRLNGMSQIEYANTDALLIGVTSLTGSVAPGTYAVNGGPVDAAAYLLTTNASCGVAGETVATSGTVTLTEVTASALVGTYSLSFGTSGSFSGSFDVSVCDTTSSGASGTGGAPVCEP